MFGFFLYFEAKGGPKNIKNLRGQGALGGGVQEGFFGGKLFMFTPFFGA